MIKHNVVCDHCGKENLSNIFEISSGRFTNEESRNPLNDLLTIRHLEFGKKQFCSLRCIHEFTTPK